MKVVDTKNTLLITKSDRGQGKWRLREYFDVCERITFGADLYKACEEADIPVRSFLSLMNKDPKLMSVYNEAIRRRNILDNEQLRKEVNECDSSNSWAVRVKVEYYSKISPKLQPNMYGDDIVRPAVNLEISIGGENILVQGGVKKNDDAKLLDNFHKVMIGTPLKPSKTDKSKKIEKK